MTEDKEMRSPQEVAAEKALLLRMKDDPPGTRYRISYQKLVMGRGEFSKLWLIDVVV